MFLTESLEAQHHISPQELKDARRGYSILNERKNKHLIPVNSGNQMVKSVQSGDAELDGMAYQEMLLNGAHYARIENLYSQLDPNLKQNEYVLMEGDVPIKEIFFLAEFNRTKTIEAQYKTVLGIEKAARSLKAWSVIARREIASLVFQDNE